MCSVRIDILLLLYLLVPDALLLGDQFAILLRLLYELEISDKLHREFLKLILFYCFIVQHVFHCKHFFQEISTHSTKH